MDSIFGLLPLLFLVLVMVWMILSQRRRQREVATMQSSLAAGDEILTVGGIVGRLTTVEGPLLGVEVSPGVVIRVDRRSISGRTSDVPAFGAGAARVDDASPHERSPRPDTTDEQA
ncbi:preprotein translocase subunit YajC [Mobilicoccus massiliensis]|uniref:preprotein translocase subunit YajC n=1 Tax=Mobilicoccus massiliensis TaxID=1522310 RepID=UPI0006937257|nr:preprotein translocase subunit YajC [Mobilicoccus massiliensis]